MDPRLQDPAKRGDTKRLYELLREDPNIFDPIDNIPFGNTPLHIAASSNHRYRNNEDPHERAASSRRMAEFAVDVAILKPSFTRKLDADGRTPMHLALESRKWTMVRALMAHDPELIRVKGRGGETPLHVAARVAPQELLAELLYLCPSSIEDVTARWKTAVHIAVEANNLESLRLILGWLSHVEKEEVLYWKDMEGNNVLHVATRMNQIQVVTKLALHMKMEGDARNFEGDTALAIHGRNSGQERNEEIGRVLGPRRSCYSLFFEWLQQDTPHRLVHLEQFLRRESSKILKLLYGIHIRAELRHILGRNQDYQVVLVVAALVATATYQGALSPPGGLWQDDSGDANATAHISTSNTTTTIAHSAGKMVMGGELASRYITASTVAFAVSVALIIACLPPNLIFGLYLFTSMCLLVSAYKSAILGILPPDKALMGHSTLKPILNWSIGGGVVFLLGRLAWITRSSVIRKLQLNTSPNGSYPVSGNRRHFRALVGYNEDGADRERNQNNNADVFVRRRTA